MPRNSLGIHLSNLLRKDDQEDDIWEELKVESDFNGHLDDDTEDLDQSSVKDLKHLFLKHLKGKLKPNKKSGRKLVVSFDLHSVTKSSGRSATTSDDSEKDDTDNAWEEEDSLNCPSKGNMFALIQVVFVINLPQRK